MMQTLTQSDYRGRWWTILPVGRIECWLSATGPNPALNVPKTDWH